MVIRTIAKTIGGCQYVQFGLVLRTTVRVRPVMPEGKILIIAHTHDRCPAYFTRSLAIVILGYFYTIGIIGCLVIETERMAGFVCAGFRDILCIVVQQF